MTRAVEGIREFFRKSSAGKDTGGHERGACTDGNRCPHNKEVTL
jgi:hypothetical protein